MYDSIEEIKVKAKVKAIWSTLEMEDEKMAGNMYESIEGLELGLRTSVDEYMEKVAEKLRAGSTPFSLKLLKEKTESLSRSMAIVRNDMDILSREIEAIEQEIGERF